MGAFLTAIKTASTLRATDWGTSDKRAIDVSAKRKFEGSVKKKNNVSPKKETDADNTRSSSDVEKSLERFDSSLAISLVNTLFIPKSEKSDISPKIDNAAE